jgi:hypothetical protein
VIPLRAEAYGEPLETEARALDTLADLASADRHSAERLARERNHTEALIIGLLLSELNAPVATGTFASSSFGPSLRDAARALRSLDREQRRVRRLIRRTAPRAPEKARAQERATLPARIHELPARANDRTTASLGTPDFAGRHLRLVPAGASCDDLAAIDGGWDGESSWFDGEPASSTQGADERRDTLGYGLSRAEGA